MKSNWDVKSPNPEIVEELQDQLEIPRLLAFTLASRGFDDATEAYDFLHPSLERDWSDPLDVPGLPEAADKIEQAILNHKKTIIFGDFDVDGISATSVMMLGLKSLGLKAAPFIPRRQDEGYGLSCEAVDRIMGIARTPESDGAGENASEGGEVVPACGFVPEMLITVDCGITSAVEVDYLKSLGVDVVVTDHHNPLNSVPTGVPVCDPRLDPTCKAANLAGVGVALKVIQELGRRMGKPELWKGLIDLAALGTIADRMSLRGENRALVKRGVEMINENPRPGIAAALGQAGSAGEECTSVGLSFSLIPRLNAAGRMADALMALDLLLCDNPAEAQGMAKRLEDINEARRQAELELSDSAEEAASLQYDGERILILADRGWHEGVKGIVASRLANKYGVPTILFTIEGDVAHGSGRSVGKINLFEAITSVKDLTVKFGGHKYAAGVTVKVKDLPEFKRRLQDYFKDFPEEDFVSTIDIDGAIGFDCLTMQQVSALDMLEPYGQDNPEPLFAMSDAFISKARAVGAKKNHLSFAITNGVENATAIYFHCNETEDYVSYVAPVDLVFSAQIEEWRGRKQLKLKVRDMEPAPVEHENEQEATVNVIDKLYEADTEKITAKRPATNSFREPPRVEEAVWELPTQEDEDYESCDFTSEIATAIAGKNIRLHQAQRVALENLDKGNSTLAIMATGRGKSLIFYIHAAKMAILHSKQSIFIYPLRALINDQAFYIGQSFSNLGLSVQTLTGETLMTERDKIYQAWQDGSTDVLLTTPEFLEYHQDKIDNGNVGFIAVDEAHHIYTSSETNRPTYTRLDFLKERFSGAVILAVSATAPLSYAQRIEKSLGITRLVTDDTVRQNLRIDDQRSLPDRGTYLASIASSGEKTVVYVNSRQMSIEIAKMLRKRLPSMAMQIAFYNAGLSRDMRITVEDMFRKGDIKVIVATGAFGEGVNIPDIRHVVMYHMPFSSASYNQIAGRAGRDGKTAYIHLLFGNKDKNVNIDLLHQYCPPREQLVLLYKLIGKFSEEFKRPVTAEELLQGCNSHPTGDKMTLISVRSGIGVFADLGFVEIARDGDNQGVTLRKDALRADLMASVRYQEASAELESFMWFSDWLMNQQAGNLLSGINRPLLPRQL